MRRRAAAVRKSVIQISAAIVVCILAWTIGTGFIRREDVVLLDYAVSQDGTEMTLLVSAASSMGYVRGFCDDGGGGKPHDLAFYSTFGGLNSALGAKNEFVLALAEGDCEIYFCRPNGGSELVLQKKIETGVWERP